MLSVKSIQMGYLTVQVEPHGLTAKSSKIPKYVLRHIHSTYQRTQMEAQSRMFSPVVVIVVLFFVDLLQK